jgi:CopG family nickel-responsive transcriptional regulator
MQRISISIDDELLDVIDALSRRRGYASRSEALRDIVRDSVMREQAADDGEAACFATLSYVYEHETRDLARRLTNAQHHHHDLSVTTLHVHVNEHDCLEVAILKGKVSDIRAFADSVTTQRGVRLHSLHIMPMDAMSDYEGHHHHHPHS